MGSRLVFVGALAAAIGCGALVGSPSSAPTGADGGTPDGGPGGADGSTEAGVDFCAGATFCDTFERSETAGPWEKVLTANGGSLATTTDRAHSGTHSLGVDLATADNSVAAMTKALPASSRVKMAFAFYMAAPAGRGFNIGLIDAQLGNFARGVYVFVNDDTFEVHEQENDTTGQTYDKKLAAIPLPKGRWAVVTFDLIAAGATGTLTVTVDDQTLLDNAHLEKAYEGAVFTAVIGSEYAAAGPSPTLIDFDDVRVDATP